MIEFTGMALSIAGVRLMNWPYRVLESQFQRVHTSVVWLVGASVYYG